MNKILKDRRLWIITIIVFVIFIAFFDPGRNLIDRMRLKEDIKELEQQKEYYLEKIAADSAMIENLKDDDFLEQYAREKYLMKREGDVVYIAPEYSIRLFVT